MILIGVSWGPWDPMEGNPCSTSVHMGIFVEIRRLYATMARYLEICKEKILGIGVCSLFVGYFRLGNVMYKTGVSYPGF